MRFEYNLKSYSNNQLLRFWERTWFNKGNTLHAIMSKSKHSWWKNNNYIEKLVTKKLSQIKYDFSNIEDIKTCC
jgi:hypothetical protein